MDSPPTDVETPAPERSLLQELLPLGHACLFVVVVVWMIMLWPSGASSKQLRELGAYASVKTERATVEKVTSYSCENERCQRIEAELQTGSRARESIDVNATDRKLSAELEEGDTVRLLDVGDDGETWLLADFDRTKPIIALTVLFVLVVGAFGRWHGIRALIGLTLGIGVLVFFLVPGVLDGRPPLAMAIVSSLAIMYLVLPLTHGLNWTTLAAMTGTVASLALIVVLAMLFSDAAHLSGFVSEESLKLRQAGFSLEGLVLGGMVIGAMGVLDDVTVSQASTVLALRRANPELSTKELLRGAISVGRDHVAATVNTLVLAYAGASLTVLLFIVAGERTLTDSINVEAISAPIIAMLVGSIGLVLAMPLTTSVAAILASRIPADRLDKLAAGAHAHHH